MEMEILQNLESPKWKKILTVEIIVFLILVAGSILLEKYSNEMEFGLLFNMEIFTILGVSSLIFSSKTTARYLAIDDNNLIFKRMLGTTLLPLAEIASIGKADDQLYGRNKDKLADPNGEARKIYGQAKDESKSRFDKNSPTPAGASAERDTSITYSAHNATIMPSSPQKTANSMWLITRMLKP